MIDMVAVGANVSLALVHYPVYDKNHQVVATAVTNLDLHDIARAAKTFGLHRYYVVTPVPEQREMAERISRHWLEGWGATYNPKRKAALELMEVASSLESACSGTEKPLRHSGEDRSYRCRQSFRQRFLR